MSEILEDQITTLLMVRNKIVKNFIGGKLTETNIQQLMIKAFNIEERFTNQIIDSLEQYR